MPMRPFGTLREGLALLALIPGLGSAEIGGAEEGLLLRGDTYLLALSPTNGSILSLRSVGATEGILHSGEQGLWHLRFRDGAELNAAAFNAESTERSFRYETSAEGKTWRLEFRSPEIMVAVTVMDWSQGIDFEGQVKPPQKAILDFALPGRLRFDPAQLERFICPMDGNQSVGVAFQGSFFQLQPPDSPSGRPPQTVRPIRYLHYSTPYPAGFADFFHLDTHVGSASLYRVQPQQWAPWEGARNPEAIFIPGRLACGGDEQGGYCDRPFGTYVAPGQVWRSPKVRLTVGGSAAEGLRAYCEANRIRRRLEEKMPPDILERFKSSVLVYYGGNCREKIEFLERLPVPTQVHFADYLRGGFDKQYPDHLPPHPDFGTPEEFRTFLDRCRQRGHLVVPYTNPTWWCDHPKGPTFEREGDAPLLRTLDGTLSSERYGPNDGFTVCHWHPAVQAANRETVRQFTEEYPTDLLFQDQCGARSWSYDTNPASPTFYAYSEGLISMVAEDCQKKPLSTESGWDRVVNYESQLCGMSWSLVPTEGGPSWRRLMKYDYPPETWEVFPLAQYIAHDKAAMLYHDLGQFVTNREVLAWALGLGFCMSYRVQAAALAEDAPREWLRWLDRLQKSVCARYVGEPIRAFEHDRGPTPTVEDDGLLRATYGPVEIVANLGPKPRLEAGHLLPPYGFYATAPGMIAANLKSWGENDFGDEGTSFVTEGHASRAEIWIYAAPEQEVGVEMPPGMVGPVAVAIETYPEEEKTLTDSFLCFRLPGCADGKSGRMKGNIKYLWHGVVTTQRP